MKATLVDSAVALGIAAPAPDYDSGYGRIQLNNTLAFAASTFRLRADDYRAGITTGSVVTHAYDVAAGTPLRATLVWSDYPAALNAAVARVNELKLEVIDPSGNVWFQRRGAGGTPEQTMTAADPHDDRNVEERLVFVTPAAGRWVVRVRGVSVPWGPQPFALLVRGNLVDCPAPAAPTAPVLTTPADRQVLVSWNSVAGAVAYNVYRSFGACPAGPWISIASAVAGTSYLDTTVSGTVTYSYYVTAASDANAYCESPRSPCASVVPTGECVLAPVFAGVATATSDGTSSCAVALTWTPASPYCGTDVRYNVYRSPTAGFTPSPANRIARCVIGNTFGDSVGLTAFTTYHYIVRSEDATSGHGGPCRDGNEDGNLAAKSVAPDGPLTLGNWSDDGGDTGTAKFTALAPWTNPATGGNLGPKVYRVTSSDGICADLTSPVITLSDPSESPELSFATIHNLDYDPFGFFGAEGSVGQAEISTGPPFNSWSRIPLAPDYPAPVDFPLNNCPTTAAATNYFSGTDMIYSTYTGSLINWAGFDVVIRFHVSGDLIYPGGSWWVDDILVTKAIVPGSCATIAAGPPPVPDGAAVPGTPMRATRTGASVALTWDATRCPATAINVYCGAIGDYTTFTSGQCSIPPTGSATVPIPDHTWFLLAATDGASTDGSHGRDSNGAERLYAGASAACPAITQHVTNNGCP